MILVAILYGWVLFVAVTNTLLMVRLRATGRSAPQTFEVLIPARNESATLPICLPPLIESGARVTVYDDASDDGTGDIASNLGAAVIEGSALPPGWTGKNHACFQLAARADKDWFLFLDADVRPSPEFATAFEELLREIPDEVGVVSGFLRMIPGEGIEPLYLSWVPWILLATNPFGLVSRTGVGHNRFTNGQFTAWRRDLYHEMQPNETLKDRVLEDVLIGRLLARRGVRVQILDATRVISVKMYTTLGEAVRGMAKNSAEIGGGPRGSALLAVVFLLLGWGWLLGGSWMWALYLMLVLSKVLTDRLVRLPLWTSPLIPLTCSAAAATVLWSLRLQRSGRREWKGRQY